MNLRMSNDGEVFFISFARAFVVLSPLNSSEHNSYTALAQHEKIVGHYTAYRYAV